MKYDWLHTGLPGLDEVIHGLRRGDNVVWQFNELDTYVYYVDNFAERVLNDNQKLIYFRFADHPPLLDMNNPKIKVYKVNPERGFESFAARIHHIISEEGQGVYYVFDCLSDLQMSWATDLMIGNFFVVVCPYLFELDTVAYFGIIRDRHSYKTVARIQETTQLFLNLYQDRDDVYLHPVKVANRYSPTMFLPHLKEDKEYIPVTSSFKASSLFSRLVDYHEKNSRRNLDYWDRLFLELTDLVENNSEQEAGTKMMDKICRLMLSKEEKTISMIKKYFDFEDLLKINTRLIGTGFIGGKALGMLLARKIVTNTTNLSRCLEEHDSYFIGSDVFYTYIVQNSWWKLRLKQKSPEGYFTLARDLRKKLLKGSFPDEIKEQFHNMLDYFGQSPIIVRSSSLQEDGYGNAFAGKYDSFFCVNQGTPEERYRKFEEAVRKVYASTMNRDALIYRQERGLSEEDEQMALLVQRVSGSYHQKYFFPDAGGVGLSYNTFAWNEKLDPKAGLLRLVFGLGTRAVNRVEGDYPRIAALDNVKLQAYADKEDRRKYSQHKLDLLNIETNNLETMKISSLMVENINLPGMKLFAKKDRETAEKMRRMEIEGEEPWIINFDTLLVDTEFTDIMKKILRKLEKAYDNPVDIEFTINITFNSEIKINLLQCRPLQTRGKENRKKLQKRSDYEIKLFKSRGNFMGGSFIQPIQRIIYVRPGLYSDLPKFEKYNIARLIGSLNRKFSGKEIPILLIGPGRWGTSTPSLGVPVSFSEINHTAVLVEIADSSSGITPELSFGSHFFQDLVETDILYIALFPEDDGVEFNEEYIIKKENKLTDIFPDKEKYKQVVKVCDINEELIVSADLVSQKVFV